MSERARAMRRLVEATRSRRRLVVLSALLGTGAVLAAIGLLTTSGYLISRAAQRPEILSLTVAIVGVRFFGTIRALLRYGERLASHELAFRSLTDLRVRFFKRLIPLVPAAVGPGISRADLLRRFVGDVDRLQDLYLQALTPPVIATASGIVAVLIATLILPEAGLVLAVAILLGGLVAPLLTRLASRSAGRRQASARARLGGDLLELIEGAPELIVAGRGADWLERCRDGDAELRRLQRRDALAGGLAGGLSTGLAVAAAVAVTAVAVPAVADGRLNGVLLAALALLALASFEAITPLGVAAANIDACGDAALRLESITERTPPVRFPAASPDGEPASRGQEHSSERRPRGAARGDERFPQAATTSDKRRPDASAPTLRAEGLAFGYGDEPLFSGLDFELRPGTITALVGPSGSGKSTLAELLVRFRNPDAGRILLDGRPLDELPEDELRAAIRLAPQDAHIFTATLRENLALGRADASPPRDRQLSRPAQQRSVTLEEDGELREALEQVGLGEWVEGLAEGLDTFLGEAGIAVSGGQRQRIAAARLLLSEAPIQIFDEPTAHLDVESGRELMHRLAARARRGDRAFLVISHEIDATSADLFDRVIELEQQADLPLVPAAVQAPPRRRSERASAAI